MIKETINQKDKEQLALYRIMWRFSAIIFLPMSLIIAIAYLPLQWIVTGKYYLNPKGWTNFMYKWGLKCGF